MKKMYFIPVLIIFAMFFTQASAQNQRNREMMNKTNVSSTSSKQKTKQVSTGEFYFTESSENPVASSLIPPAPTSDALLFCDFKDGIPSGWDNWDFDEIKVLYNEFTTDSGSPWIVHEYSLTRSAAISSSFFYNEYADPGEEGQHGQANDWLVTPNVQIPNNDDSYVIAWHAINGDMGFPESYELRIIEDNDYQNLLNKFNAKTLTKAEFGDALETTSTLKLFVDEEVSIWNKREINIDSYKGKNIRAIWRNNTNEGSFICISSIMIGKEKEEAPDTGLNEGFENPGVPDGWEAKGPWNAWNKWHFAVNGNMVMDGSYAWFDSNSQEWNVEGSLITPTITPTKEYPIFSYEVQQFEIPSGWPDFGAILFVEVSKDGGRTFTTSADNVLRELPKYNRATSPITKMYLSLEDYVGKNVKVRFRAISDYGDYIIAIDNVKLEAAPTFTDAGLKVPKFTNTKIPYRQMDFIPTAEIYNYGMAIEEKDATFKIQTNQSYFFEKELNKVPAHGKVYLMADEFITEETGNITFTYSVNLLNDNEHSDNTVEISTEITPNVFAVDNGTISETKGLGYTNGERSSFGNRYTLIKRDRFVAIEYAFFRTDDIPYSLSILDVGKREIIYTSEILNKPSNYKMGEMLTHTLPVPLDVEAGDYGILIDQFSDWVGIAIDNNPDGSFYLLSNFDVFPNKLYEFGGANVVMRAIVSGDLLDIKSMTPRNASRFIDLDAEVSISFSKEIKLSDSPKVTINNITVAKENLVVEGNKLIIKHEKFNPTTKYTINVSENTVENYTIPTSWYFTTDDADAIDTAEKTDIKVFPTICKNGQIDVVAPGAGNVKIVDFSGRLMKSQLINGNETIDMDYPAGIYLVLVEMADGTNETYKVIVQK